jgi:signal peptidase I
LEEGTQLDTLQSSAAQADPPDAVTDTATFPPAPASVVLEPPLVSPAQAPAGESIMALVREILETIIFALLVFLLVQAVSRNYKVQSISMQPNLYEGQYLVVNRLVYARSGAIDLLHKTAGKIEPARRVLDAVFHSPQRGEVLVFVPVTNTKPDLIKRVIGIEGDKVELKQGQIYINDKPVEEPYIRPAPMQSFGPVVVGKDQLFVMGDNRGNSSDSRVFGMLPIKNVIGKAWLRYWPPSAWGFIRHHNLAQQLH